MKFSEIFNYADKTKDDEKRRLGQGVVARGPQTRMGKLVEKYEGNKPVE
jgi:hypothetical protein